MKRKLKHQYKVRVARICDLPKSQDLSKVAVRLPKQIYRESALPRHSIKNVPVYLIGWMMDDYFVKIDPCSSAMYPMLWARLPAGFNEWEVLADSLPLHK